jgi:3-methylcrotonyl-CoA carboxylase alpha subunit
MTGHAFEARIYCEDPFQDFLPSSGEIVHMRVPKTGNPRLDFTFAEKSVISALYDPMIGKLIVHGDSREEALAKMVLALTELEIVGPTTNIEFLRRVCLNPDFGSENPTGLETGFIPKHRDQLMASIETPGKVYAQAALGELLSHTPSQQVSGSFGQVAGWSHVTRYIDFADARVAIENVGGPSHAYTVTVSPKRDGAVAEKLVVRRANYDPATRKLLVSFTDSQMVNSVVVEADRVHVFDSGVHYTLDQPAPEWLTKSLGVKDTKHSVVAPMPCTIARVHVKPGEVVKKDQELLVILSMKMETTIRSPKDGIVMRIPHGEGEIVKQGVELVEFEHAEE